MWTSSCCPALLLAVSWSPLAVFAWQADECVGRGSCSAKGMAQDSILLQSKYSMNVEVSSQEAEEDEFDGEVDDEQDLDLEEGLVFNDALIQGAPAEPEKDWMMEVTLDNQWIAGGGPSDSDYNGLSEADKPEFTKAAHHKAESIFLEGQEEAFHEREAWRQQFATDHQKAVSALQRRPNLARLDPIPCGRYNGAGEISGLYTYGAPGTALSPFRNEQREDGKFPGLRLVTQRVERVWKITRTYHDPVPFFAGLVGMKHPHMDLLLLPVNQAPQLHDASREVSLLPRSDFGFWVRGHFQDIYYDQLLPHVGAYDPKALELLHLSMAVCPAFNNHSREGNARQAAKVGWNLVAQSTNHRLRKREFIFQDNTSLYQNPETQACALSFVHTHHITHWFVNLRFRPSTFCGIKHVHIGFRNQVLRVLRSSSWAQNMLPAMSACSKLYITGHSLGGAQAQLVAACLQRAPARGQDGWDDYRHMIWKPNETAVRTLPPIA